MSFFYYLRKLTSFTHGWLLSLRLCSFFVSIFCGSECVLLFAVGLFLLLSNLFGCCLRGVLLKGGRGCFDEEFLSALFSLAREKGEELVGAEDIIGLVFQRRNKVAVFERGARWGRSLLARDDDEMIVWDVC